jgi:hypothetical protein
MAHDVLNNGANEFFKVRTMPCLARSPLYALDKQMEGIG